MEIRRGTIQDLDQIRNLAIEEWSRFEHLLSPDNWLKLRATITSENTFSDLLINAICFVCINNEDELTGVSFLVSSGNPTTIYSAEQCYIRFVTASSKYKGQKIGERLTEKCIEAAKENNESCIALHTSVFMPAARHIYEKLGFVIVRELEPILGKQYWLYEKKLLPQ